MAAKSHTSFQKRQKEIARMEKQREKAVRRMQRKLARKQAAGSDTEPNGPEQTTPETPSNP
jgi:hypothetical protein